MKIITDVPEVAGEATTGGILQKNVFLKCLQYSQENTYLGVSF